MNSKAGARDNAPMTAATTGYAIDPKLLEMLACPLTKMPLVWSPDKNELISRAARLAYPIRDGVPIMLPSEARHLDDDEFSR